MTGIVGHALGLHLHQPPGNLLRLSAENPFAAEQIIRCYERLPRYVGDYADVAAVHVAFSGVLLEQLRDPAVIDRYRHWVDIPHLLHRYAQMHAIELVGTGYFHPIFPWISVSDWRDQIDAGYAIISETFGRAPRGFWPPEMAFTMEMIPLLVRAGFDYVIVDGDHLRPYDGVEDGLRPYRGCYNGVCIDLVPRDRVFSNAQQGGQDPEWLTQALETRRLASPRPHESRLMCSWCGGENGGWFRQLNEHAGFFGVFFAPYMERVRAGVSPIRTVHLSDYLFNAPPLTQATVQSTSTWMCLRAGQLPSCCVDDPNQQQIINRIADLSQRYAALMSAHPVDWRYDSSPRAQLRRLLLQAQTSCYIHKDGLLRSEQLQSLLAAVTAQLAALERV